MNEQAEVNDKERAEGQSRLNVGLAIDRTGYCAYCRYNPGELITIAAQDRNSKCCGCWFSEDKPNWEQMANDKLRGAL